jgi:lauroyl/myristoyl acyltransferase
MILLKINKLIQPWDYGWFLPRLAELPIFCGRGMAQCRGVCCALLDYDWRSNAINLLFVRGRVMEIMRTFSSDFPSKGMVQRFINNSIEEWQSCLFRHQKKMVRISKQSDIDHLIEYKQLAEKKRGVVMVSAHFDSFCMGMVLMGMQGLRVHCINTSEIENPIIHPVVRSFFQKKYRSMESLMNGKMPYYQNGMDFFYEKLNQGEMVVLMGDIPGSRSTVKIDFLGKKFRLPLGAWYMAKKTNSLLGAYITLGFSGGRYHTVCIPPYEPDTDDPVGSLMPIYIFLESWIKTFPEKWVTSDLLYGY